MPLSAPEECCHGKQIDPVEEEEWGRIQQVNPSQPTRNPMHVLPLKFPFLCTINFFLQRSKFGWKFLTNWLQVFASSPCIFYHDTSIVLGQMLLTGYRCWSFAWQEALTRFLNASHALTRKDINGEITALNAVFALHNGHLNHLGHPLVTACSAFSSATRHEQQTLCEHKQQSALAGVIHAFVRNLTSKHQNAHSRQGTWKECHFHQRCFPMT